MDSSEQTVLSSAVSWMSTAMATRAMALMATNWHRPADCTTREPWPRSTGNVRSPTVDRRVTGTTGCARWCQDYIDRLYNNLWCQSKDTSGRRGPPHTGGRWWGRTEPGRVEAAGRELPVYSRSADSSSASAAHEEAASRGRTSVMSRPAERRRSTS